jgi:hypothetical protein
VGQEWLRRSRFSSKRGTWFPMSRILLILCNAVSQLQINWRE